MTNPNDKAFPEQELVALSGGKEVYQSSGGLTKREYFAAVALGALVTHKDQRLEFAANNAVRFADALIAKLNEVT